MAGTIERRVEDRALRALARAGGLVVLTSVASCSFVLDWGDYTRAFGGDDAGDAGLPDGAAEASTCTASNCGGCCGANGVCSPGVVSDVCGAAGAACVDCASSGQRCLQGACAPPLSVDSGPSCTDPACEAMTYKCPSVGVFVSGQLCCQPNGICGCAYGPGSALKDVSCGPRP